MRRFPVAGWILAASLATAPAPAIDELTVEDYEAAAQLLEGQLAPLVENASVQPHWISSGFWYERHGSDEAELVVFELGTRKRRPAFDHRRIREAIRRTLAEDRKENEDEESEEHEDELPSLDDLADKTLSEDLATLTATWEGRLVTCSLAKAHCEVTSVAVPEPGLLPSPDGRLAVLSRDDNLYLRATESGEETQLTDDGRPFYSYGKWPDSSLTTISVKKSGTKLPPYSATWSPDSRYFVVPRIDERLLPPVPFVEWVPTDGSRRPVVHEVREPLTGDRDEMQVEWFVFDAESKRGVAVDAGKEIEPEMLNSGVLDWNVASGHAYMLWRGYAGKEIGLLRIDLATGTARSILREGGAKTRFEPNTLMYNRPNVRVLSGGDRVVWYSDRTGWGHLYLYDGKSGELLKAVTEGDWAVIDVHAVDEERQEIYFTAGGREPGRDPYLRHLYKASLDPRLPTRVVLLTEADADHHFRPDPVPLITAFFGTTAPPPLIRPDLGVFVDTYSTVEEPPVTVLRSSEDGRLLAELERADASALFAAGYVPPERRAFTAADGETSVYSVYTAPKRRLGGGKHPVVDAVYGGPQVFVAPRNFMEAVRGTNPVGDVALSRLGFAVVTTDGRGTPGRSRAFRDAGYVEFTQVGIEDHVAVLEQWAERKPEMDLNRVGIYGWSWGGTFTAQAILSRPDFYDVAVSGAGVYDYAAIYPGFESVTGPPLYEDGSRYRTRRDESPASWESLDITRLAPDLEGKLLLVYGDMDENVPQAQVMRLVDALTRANKPYDLLYLPNRTHRAAGEPYVLLRTWDYFVEHLLDVKPPRDVMIESPFVSF